MGWISSAFRSLSIAFFSIIGVALGFVVVVLLVGGLVSSNRLVEPNYEARVEANAEGSTEVLGHSQPVVLQIAIDEVIGLRALTGDQLMGILNASRQGLFEGSRVKAILLKINSPGGTALDADAIYRALLEYKSQYKVPIYAYVDGLCASGGFYIACAADEIYASDSSLIGSVGVTSTFFNVSDLMKRVGVSALDLISGQYKDDLSPFRPWKAGEEARWKAISDYYYDRFIGIVTAARPALSKEALINNYGAQIFPAPLAAKYGYIDAAGSSRAEVLKALVKAAKIQEPYQVVSLHQEIFLNGLLGPNNTLLKGQLIHKIEGFDAELINKPLYLFSP